MFPGEDNAYVVFAKAEAILQHYNPQICRWLVLDDWDVYFRVNRSVLIVGGSTPCVKLDSQDGFDCPAVQQDQYVP